MRPRVVSSLFESFKSLSTLRNTLMAASDLEFPFWNWNLLRYINREKSWRKFSTHSSNRGAKVGLWVAVGMGGKGYSIQIRYWNQVGFKTWTQDVVLVGSVWSFLCCSVCHHLLLYCQGFSVYRSEDSSAEHENINISGRKSFLFSSFPLSLLCKSHRLLIMLSLHSLSLCTLNMLQCCATDLIDSRSSELSFWPSLWSRRLTMSYSTRTQLFIMMLESKNKFTG